MESPIKTWLDVQKHIQQSLTLLHGAEEARSISFFWLKDVFGVERSSIIAQSPARLNTDQLDLLIRDVETMASGVPLQYVLGKTMFLDFQFKVNPNVLIPRPETEELVLLCAKRMSDIEAPKILDVCTGSGCIAVSLAKLLPNAEVSAIDISEDALELAIQNAVLNETDVHFSRLDVLKDEFPKERLNLVVSNPPYVLEREKREMAKHVLEHEPHLALFVTDADPLVFYRQIGEKAFDVLLPKGVIAFEINAMLGIETRELMEEIGFQNVQLIQDINGKDRFVIGEKR